MNILKNIIAQIFNIPIILVVLACTGIWYGLSQNTEIEEKDYLEMNRIYASVNESDREKIQEFFDNEHISQGEYNQAKRMLWKKQNQK